MPIRTIFLIKKFFYMFRYFAFNFILIYCDSSLLKNIFLLDFFVMIEKIIRYTYYVASDLMLDLSGMSIIISFV